MYLAGHLRLSKTAGALDMSYVQPQGLVSESYAPAFGLDGTHLHIAPGLDCPVWDFFRSVTVTV